MKLDDLKHSIDSLSPSKELKARILALPSHPSRLGFKNSRLQVAVLGGACLLCVGVVAAVMMLKFVGKPGIDVVNPASSHTNLAAVQRTETASPAKIQITASPNKDPNPLDETTLEPTSPVISSGQDFGADMVSLDYASDDTVIFHGYFGLFVYDLKSQKILRSLDLNLIGCNATQGDNYCVVSVSVDGNTVQLHARSNKNMYIYTISDNTLRETVFAPMNNQFTGFVDTTDAIGQQKMGYFSYQAVPFATGEHGYLQSSDWTIRTLTYVRGDAVYIMFENLSKETSAS